MCHGVARTCRLGYDITVKRPPAARSPMLQGDPCNRARLPYMRTLEGFDFSFRHLDERAGRINALHEHRVSDRGVGKAVRPNPPRIASNNLATI